MGIALSVNVEISVAITQRPVLPLVLTSSRPKNDARESSAAANSYWQEQIFGA
jgi:hypothetical protein